MASPAASGFILLLIVSLSSAAAHGPDASASSPASEGHHLRHRHHHRGKHQTKPPPTTTARTDTGVDVFEDLLRVTGDKPDTGSVLQGEEREEKDISDQANTTTTSSPLTLPLQASQVNDSDSGHPDGQQAQPDNTDQQSPRLNTQGAKHDTGEDDEQDRQRVHTQDHGEAQDTMSSRLNVTDTETDEQVSVDAVEQPETTGEEEVNGPSNNATSLPGTVTSNATSASSSDTTPATTSPRKPGQRKLPADYIDKKLVNRPRWVLLHETDAKHKKKHGRKTAHKSAHKHKSGKLRHGDQGRDPSPKPRGERKPGKGAKRSWSNNRPVWGSSTETSEDLPDPDQSGASNRTTVPSRQTSSSQKNPRAEDTGKTREKKGSKRPTESKKPSLHRKKGKSKKSRHSQGKGCPGCNEKEIRIAEARELHKEVLKAQLLDKLRLVPTFKQRPSPPKLPDQVFPDPPQRDGTGHDDRYYAKPTQLLVFGRDLGPNKCQRGHGMGCYQFGVTGKVKGGGRKDGSRGVRSARLWVYKMRDANDAHGQTLRVYELSKGKTRRLTQRSLVARLDTHVQEGWVSFDVSRVVRGWQHRRTPASLQMLAIRCGTCHRTNYRSIFGVKSNFRPVLAVTVGRADDGEEHNRSPRSTCDPTTRCCKFDFSVRFQDLGIHEIFWPRTIKADYCYGTCELPGSHHYNHTMLMQHVRFNSQAGNATLRDKLRPCCVPVVLREAYILHYLNEGLDTQRSLVPNLLVERCGCA